MRETVCAHYSILEPLTWPSPPAPAFVKKPCSGGAEKEAPSGSQLQGHTPTGLPLALLAPANHKPPIRRKGN